MTKPRRVFLSHTSELRRHPEKRSFVEAAVEAVLRAEHLPSDMEYFTAREGNPADYCRMQVKKAHLYVGIIGFRYGSPVPDLEQIQSYTELEFETATELGMDRLVFLLSEQHVVGLPPVAGWDAYKIRQEAFRERLLNCGITVSEVHSPDHLAFKLLDALHQLGGGAPVHAPRVPVSLDSQAWKQLKDLLHRVDPEGWSKEAYRWSFGVNGKAGLAAAPFDAPSGDLYDWALDLDAREQDSAALPKVVAFAHALASGFSTAKGAARQRGFALNTWVREVRERLGLPEPPSASEINRLRISMLVRLEQDPREPCQLLAEVLLHPSLDPSLWQRVQPPENATGPLRVTMNGARDLVRQCLDSFLEEARAFCDQAVGHAQPPHLERVEFEVTEALLETEFDQWVCGDDPYLSQRLGEQYEVIVRCPSARDLPNSPSLWYSRWAWLARCGGTAGEATSWLGDLSIEELRRHVSRWAKYEHPACVAITANDAGPARHAALRSGIPVIVWQRSGDPRDATSPGLQELLPIADVTELPRAVKELRADPDLPPAAQTGVVLLWDDPDHPLATVPLTDASFI
ncbi:DUF4062 domain-containing protein [Streptomyces sp. NPDC046909]|uniref:VMAP-C domain-containing protein n=1 Tax=Streptomyces sp. NPDC046909 TaxID=3155617 RepID=UPI003401D892